MGCGGKSSSPDAIETSVAPETSTVVHSPASPTPTVVPASDLVVDMSMVEEHSAMAGESIVLNVTLRNQGADSSDAATLTYFRSTDSIISTEDVEEDTVQVDGLAPSESSEESVSLTVPITPGTYHYGACVDSVTYESNTTNNCSDPVTVTVLPLPPDQLVDTPTVDEDSPMVGQSLILSVAVRNQGTGRADGTTLTYYRSTDSTISSDDLEEESFQVAGLAPSESTQESVTLTVPSTPGTYYYGACVDSVLYESDTTNNCSDPVAVTVRPLPSDLVVDAPTVEVDSLMVGQSLKLSVTVQNQGIGPADGSNLTYYRSTDSMISSDDVEEGTVLLPSIAPSESTLESVSLIAPFTPGTYHYVACVDPVAHEADTANNCSAPVVVRVLPLPPDLLVEAMTLEEDSSIVGHSFNLIFTVRNLGSSSSDAATLTYYITPDSTISSADVEEGTVQIPGLAPLGSSHETLMIIAPPVPGTYYYRACTDSVAHEVDTANNCSGYVAVNVVPFPPDLAVGAPTLGDRSQVVGQSLTLNVTLSNQGEGASGTNTLRFLRSDDAIITHDDIEIGTVQVEELRPSGFTHESLALAAPPSPGTYHYGVCINPAPREPETSNNCSDSVAVTVVPLPTYVAGDAPRVNVGPQTIINSIDAQATGFRLYDRRWDAQGDESFVYENTFDELTTGDVNWELNLTHALRSESTPYAIEIVTYRPNGSVLQRRHFNTRVSDSRIRSSPSSVLVVPTREPGSWRAGTYRVELLVANQLVASGEFQIVRGRIPQTAEFKVITESLDWSEVPGTPDERLGLLALAGLLEANPELASTVAGNPWVQQNLTEETLRFLRVLHVLAREDMGLAERMAELPWLADEVTYDEWLALRTLTTIAIRDIETARFIGGFDWISDGVTALERKALSVLRDIIIEQPKLASEVLKLSWLGDDLTQDESTIINSLRGLAYKDPELPLKVLAMPFLQGAIGTIQANVMTGIASASPYPSSSDTPTLTALEWLVDDPDEIEARLVHDLGIIRAYSDEWFWAVREMPFLETIEPADALATQSLRRLFDLNIENLDQVMSHPRIMDGITDDETRIVATLSAGLYSLSGVSEYNPALLETLLDPDQATVEERTITLPLAGETALTIIRTSSGSKRTMDLLETAAKRIEGLMALPFPTHNLIYLFEVATPSALLGRFAGANLGSNIVSLPWYDDDALAVDSSLEHLVHEVSHYYWTGNRSWVDEGAANLVQSIVSSMEYDRSISPQSGSCAKAGNIAELESLESTQQSEAFLCNYYFGERLFHGLYNSLGDPAFRSGFSRLFLLSQHDDPNDECEGTRLEICHVRSAFTSGLDEASAGVASGILDRWYDGN